MPLSMGFISTMYILRNPRPAETNRMAIVKTDAAKVNNAPGVQLKAREVAAH